MFYMYHMQYIWKFFCVTLRCPLKVKFQGYKPYLQKIQGDPYLFFNILHQYMIKSSSANFENFGNIPSWSKCEITSKFCQILPIIERCP